MAKVRVPVYGSVGKSVRVDQDATKGATLGVNLYDANGNVLDIDALAALLATEVQEINIEDGGTVNPTIFETDIVDGALLARVSDNETIDGNWTHTGTLTLSNTVLVDLIDAETFTINKAGTGDITIQQSGTGNIVFDKPGSGEIRFLDDVHYRDGADVIVYSPNNLQTLTISLDNTDALIAGVGADQLQFAGFNEYVFDDSVYASDGGMHAAGSVQNPNDSANVPVAYAGIVGGTTAEFGGYNWFATAYQPVRLNGSVVNLFVNNASRLQATSTYVAIESSDLWAQSGFSVQGTVSDVGQVGQFAFMDVTGGVSRFGSYNWDTVAWQPLLVRGSAVEIAADSGVEVQFTSGISIEETDARLYIKDTDAVLDEKDWLVQSASGNLRFYAANDARSSFSQFLLIERTAMTVDQATWDTPVRFNNGINFGAVVAAGVTDLTEHVDLYGGTYGFSITASNLNLVANAVNTLSSTSTVLTSKVNHDFLLGIDVTGNITVTGTVDGRDVAADGTKLDGIESGATADQTAGEIEAIVNHDNLLGFVANEHIDWTADQGGTQININNMSPDRHGVTPASNIVEFARFGAGVDLDTIVEPGQYGLHGSMTNGPSGATYDPMWVGASASDVISQLVVPRTASRALAYRGETSSVFTAWHYAAWTTTAADADLSLYQKSAANTLDAVVTNGDTINAGVGLVELTIPAGGTSIEFRTDTTVGGWARGIAYERKSDSTIIGGYGMLGTGEAANSFHVGFGPSWWATDAVLDLTTALFTVGNYSFDIDQTVGAGQDNYVLTYDNASGLISLEAAVGGGTIGGSITNDQVAYGAATANEIEGSANLTFDGTTLTISNVLAISGNTIDLISGTYLNVKGNSDSAGGVRLYDNTGNIRGYYYYNASASGLLHSGGGWAMQIAHGTTTVTFPGNVNVNTGLDVTGNLTVEGDSTNVVRAVDYNNTGYDHWNYYNTGAVTAGTWYTIATDPSGLDITTTPVGKTGASRSAARFRVYDIDSGQHSFCEFEVSVNYGRRPTITIINRSSYGSGLSGVRGIRLIRYSTYNGHAIQILAGHTGTMYYVMQELGVSGGFKGRDWIAETPEANWHVEELDFNNLPQADARFAVLTGPATGADDQFDGILVGDGRFYPAVDGGGTGEGYFEKVTGSYGGVQVNGSAGSSGTWTGYSLQGEYVLMSYAGVGRCGIYNDVDNEWMMQWYRNGAVVGYHNGATVFTTVSNGLRIHQNNDSTTDYIELRHDGTNAHMDIGSYIEFFVTGNGITLDNTAAIWGQNFAGTSSVALVRCLTDDAVRVGGTTGFNTVELCYAALVVADTQDHDALGNAGGFRVYDHSGTWRDAGFADSKESRTNTSFTFGAQDIDNVAHYTNGSNYNATLAASTDLDFPVGARMDIINRAAGTININQGTGTTLYWDDGGGASFTTGNRDLTYGWVTIWRQSATVYYITGTGLT